MPRGSCLNLQGNWQVEMRAFLRRLLLHPLQSACVVQVLFRSQAVRDTTHARTHSDRCGHLCGRSLWVICCHGHGSFHNLISFTHTLVKTLLYVSHPPDHLCVLWLQLSVSHKMKCTSVFAQRGHWSRVGLRFSSYCTRQSGCSRAMVSDNLFPSLFLTCTAKINQKKIFQSMLNWIFSYCFYSCTSLLKFNTPAF